MKEYVGCNEPFYIKKCERCKFFNSCFAYDRVNKSLRNLGDSISSYCHTFMCNAENAAIARKYTEELKQKDNNSISTDLSINLTLNTNKFLEEIEKVKRSYNAIKGEWEARIIEENDNGQHAYRIYNLEYTTIDTKVNGITNNGIEFTFEFKGNIPPREIHKALDELFK